MKRRYKPGDWFRVPLFAQSDAIGIITHASRSRLFGYFFAAPDGEVSFEYLKTRAPAAACARFLFGASPLELLRWPVLATSLSFDPAAWPLPTFAQRGAFGRRWTLRTFDPETLQRISETQSHADEAAGHPAAQFLGIEEAEAVLASAVNGADAPVLNVICEVRAPVDEASLVPLARGGRVQVTQALDGSCVATLSRTLAHPSIELRVHDVFGEPFDLRVLRLWPGLRALALDTENLAAAESLPASLPVLQRLRIRAALLESLPASPSVCELHVTGAGERVQFMAWHALEALSCQRVAIDHRARLPHALHSLTLRHCTYDLAWIAAHAPLERLELHGGALSTLEPLAGARVRALTLRGVRLLRDISALAQLPELRVLRLQKMPQLHPHDFKPLANAGVRVIADSGNRTIDREIQRALARRELNELD